MASTVSYSASLCTRLYNSSSNAKNGYASQEFYDSSYNNVGIISFVGMNLANKVITSIWLDIDASKAGYHLFTPCGEMLAGERRIFSFCHNFLLNSKGDGHSPSPASVLFFSSRP